LVQLDLIPLNSHHFGKKPPRLRKVLLAGSGIISIAWPILAQEVLLRREYQFKGERFAARFRMTSTR
jgi:hypothetical protein